MVQSRSICFVQWALLSPPVHFYALYGIRKYDFGSTHKLSLRSNRLPLPRASGDTESGMFPSIEIYIYTSSRSRKTRRTNSRQGIDVSTGPLGQGVANATGLAMAAKHLGSAFNRPGFPIVENTTWCIAGDACLQEGPALEAISLAGHWGLDNLVLIYDNNQIQSDGPVCLTNREDVNEKMKACGWNVLVVEDGSSNVDAIVATLEMAKVRNGKPTFINVRTEIGIHTSNANTRKAHGTPLGEKEVSDLKSRLGLDPSVKFHVPQEILEFFSLVKLRGDQHVLQWHELLQRYETAYPQLSGEFRKRMSGDFTELADIYDLTARQFVQENNLSISTRHGSKYVIHSSLKNNDSFIVGTADLDSSVALAWDGKEDFQSVRDDPTPDSFD